MQTFTFQLNISPDDWMAYYTGQAKHVVATAGDGRTVRFAAKHLQRHYARDGINGLFRMTVDHDNNFQRLEKLDG